MEEGCGVGVEVEFVDRVELCRLGVVDEYLRCCHSTSL